ncbi:MAG: TonB-dependent receptor family protein [Haliscomenobacter sp.]
MPNWQDMGTYTPLRRFLIKIIHFYTCFFCRAGYLAPAMKKISVYPVAVFLFLARLVSGQGSDTTLQQTLNEITVTSYKFPIQALSQLKSVHQTYLTSGKKQEVITVQDLPANLAEKTGRQIFAKIPGAFVYDMDGSGNQVNISTRGLDPHRSWEYNIRQNGIMTNSDIYGYPASHYSPPMEAIQRIELIRGTASLQYGSQFGGMINYITKEADPSRSLQLESLNSIGSYGLLSTFHALGGKTGKLSYYGYYQRRVSNGYREQSKSDAQAQFVRLQYDWSEKLQLNVELGRSQYVYQIPGPLTDAMFEENPRQSTRSRNYFNPDIFVPSVTLTWKPSEATTVSWVHSAVRGTRNSVQFIGFADMADTINPLTLQYSSRQVDIDRFNSYTSELRIRQDYHLAGGLHTLVFGTRLINNDLHRQQLGKGTTGTDFDLQLTTPDFGRDIHFKTRNAAFSAENLFRIGQHLEVSAGLRVEAGTSTMSGKIIYLPTEKVPLEIAHRFPLFGANIQYQLSANNRLYGGWSQAYRPVLFADIIPASAIELADPAIQDAFGHNLEAGIKGVLFQRIHYDFNVFQILYKNRVGTLVLSDPKGNSYIWRTNIGDSRTNGIELYAEWNIAQTNTYRVSIFSASAYFDGIYLRGAIRSGSENTDISGNRLETTPRWISRNGLQAGYKTVAGILQFSYVGKSYSDALNTEKPSANGAKGPVPAYAVWDLNLSWRINTSYQLKLGINNLANASYFTKRPGGYPGQGVWSSDGRSVVVTVGVRL